MSKPEEVIFSDYEVGETYTQHLTLTNVSYTINTLKLIGMSTNLLDFIAVEFSPPGHLSAGGSCFHGYRAVAMVTLYPYPAVAMVTVLFRNLTVSVPCYASNCIRTVLCRYSYQRSPVIMIFSVKNESKITIIQV